MDGSPSDHQRKRGPDGYGGWLRARSDTELAVLLSARPDLLVPAPAGSDVLASRATGRRSLERALDGLDQFSLQVLGSLSAAAEASTAGLAETLGIPPDPLRRCVDTLCARALAWDAGGTLHTAPGLGAVIGEAAAPAGTDPAAPEPPPLDVQPGGQRMVDRAAAGAAADSVRRVADLLSLWAGDPPPVLRAGGVGIRSLRRTAAALDIPVADAALYAETARAAGLLAASGWADGDWLPTGRYDGWRELGTAGQWTVIAGAWLTMSRVPALTGRRDERGRLLNALGGGLDRMDAPAVRAMVLGQLDGAGGSVQPGSLLRRLAWLRPRRQGPVFTLLVETALREAAMLGLTGLGALAAHGRALAGGDAEAAEAALSSVLPEPVGHVLLQADLTAVAPGPLVPELAAELALMAAVESTGGATVYRFTTASVRRALDAGRSASDLLAFLDQRSATPVPQPLRYLVEDLARRHGRVRVGTASAYVRCEDPAVIAEIAADQRASRLRLRKLAPTVLASPSDRGALLETLRELGYAPAAESADGTVEVSSPAARRSTAPAAVRGAPGTTPGPRAPAGPDDEMVRAAVREIRAGDEAAAAVRHLVPGALAGAPAGNGTGDRAGDRARVEALVSALSTAAAAGERVWVGYVDSAGVARSRILKPERVEGGYMTAYDASRATVHRLALHRITGVAVLTPAELDGPGGAR
jgi:hypothetical protein